VKILVIHGPNLDALGAREPEVYGTGSLADVNAAIVRAAEQVGVEVSITQTAREGEIIELLHQGAGEVEGAIVNPGAYAHTSRAIADAFRSVPFPVVEVHLSNIHAREGWRRHSVTAEAAAGIVSGFGAQSYVVALNALIARVGGDGDV
jgi:3-dehydroquinate dehydratase-2